MTVPHITIEQATAIWSNPIDKKESTAIFNKRIDAYNEKQATEQPLITAEEARKLGAGKAEYLDEDNEWRVCSSSCKYRDCHQYRAIKQPERLYYKTTYGGWIEWLEGSCVTKNHPAFEWTTNTFITEPFEPHAELKAMYEQQVKDGTLKDYYWQFKDSGGISWLPILTDLVEFHACNKYQCIPKETCQVRNLDTGELKTMTREAAKLLQAELGDTVEWENPLCGDDTVDFIISGIYTYRLKANLVKLDGELMTREVAIAKWESKKDVCEFLVKGAGDSDFEVMKHNHHFNEYAASGCEYQLREKPTVKLTIDDEPAKMLTPAQCEAERLARIDTHDVFYWQFGVNKGIRPNPAWASYEAMPLSPEYKIIRKQPKLKPLEWKSVPVGVMTNKGELREVYEAIYGDDRLQAVVEVSMPVAGKKTCQREFYCKDLTLAPASEQPWIAVQDGIDCQDLMRDLSSKGFTYVFCAMRFRITGLAEGWVLK